LLRQTSLLTFPGDSEARFLLTILRDTENSRSQGTVVAGVVRYLQASETMVEKALACDICMGTCSILQLPSTLGVAGGCQIAVGG